MQQAANDHDERCPWRKYNYESCAKVNQLHFEGNKCGIYVRFIIEYKVETLLYIHIYIIYLIIKKPIREKYSILP